MSDARGLLIDGKLHDVAGVECFAPASHGGPRWARLDGRDYERRDTSWVRLLIAHTTKGITPQHIIPGKGPEGKGQIVADYWRGDPKSSAAHLVIGTDGSIVCLADLKRDNCYNAGDHVANETGVGVELYQTNDGGIYAATLDAWATLAARLCDLLSIPRWYQRSYGRGPLARFAGPKGGDVCGVVGHRDISSNRGAGDPGSLAFDVLNAMDFEPIDFDRFDDLARCRARQKHLKAMGCAVGVDGLYGAETERAWRSTAYRRWRDVPTTAPAERAF